jgi:hypothetical protein
MQGFTGKYKDIRTATETLPPAVSVCDDEARELNRRAK